MRIYHIYIIYLTHNVSVDLAVMFLGHACDKVCYNVYSAAAAAATTGHLAGQSKYTSKILRTSAAARFVVTTDGRREKGKKK